MLGERALLERERERVIQLFLRGWHISLAAGIWEECRAMIAPPQSSTASDEVPLCKGATVVIQKLFNNQCNLGTGPNCRLRAHPAIAFKLKSWNLYSSFIFHSSKNLEKGSKGDTIFKQSVLVLLGVLTLQLNNFQ